MDLGPNVAESGVAGQRCAAALLQPVLTPDPDLGVADTGLGAACPDPTAPPSGCLFHPRCARPMAPCGHDAPRPVPMAGGHVE